MMTTHDLAIMLLECPDLPVAVHANNHTFMAGMGEIKVGLLGGYAGDHVVIGNIQEADLNGKNWYIKKMLKSEVA